MDNKGKKKSLDKRFKDFLDTLDGVENIDQLSLSREQVEAQKADYFAKNRQVIIELKSLETDTDYKIEKILEPHRSRPEFPIAFGDWEVRKLLKFLPDGDAINKQMVDAATSAIEVIYRKANKQIRTTKSTFDLLGSQGFLIILNERIDVLEPAHIIYKLRRMLGKRHPDRSFQFPEVNYVLVLSEAHFSTTEDNLMGFPVIHLPINIVGKFQHTDFVEFLSKKWAQYNNSPLRGLGEIQSLDEINLQSVSRHLEENKKEVPRQEIWKRYYRRNPYFRSYDKKKMIWMYGMIMTELAYGLSKFASKTQKERVKFWNEVFTHFVEEVNHRAMDFKIFIPISKKIGAEISDEFMKYLPNSFNSKS